MPTPVGSGNQFMKWRGIGHAIAAFVFDSRGLNSKTLTQLGVDSVDTTAAPTAYPAQVAGQPRAPAPDTSACDAVQLDPVSFTLSAGRLDDVRRSRAAFAGAQPGVVAEMAAIATRACQPCVPP